MEASPWFGLSSAVSSAGSAYLSSQSAKLNAEARARMAGINARIAELNAQSIQMQGQREAGSLSLRAGQIKGSQRAALAANGVDLGEGSAAEVQTSTDLLKEIDMHTATSNALARAWGARMDGLNATIEGTVANATAGAISPAFSGSMSLLGSASTVASKWYGTDALQGLNNWWGTNMPSWAGGGA